MSFSETIQECSPKMPLHVALRRNRGPNCKIVLCKSAIRRLIKSGDVILQGGQLIVNSKRPKKKRGRMQEFVSQLCIGGGTLADLAASSGLTQRSVQSYLSHLLSRDLARRSGSWKDGRFAANASHEEIVSAIRQRNKKK